MKRRGFLKRIAALLPLPLLLKGKEPDPVAEHFLSQSDATPPLPLEGHTFTYTANDSIVMTVQSEWVSPGNVVEYRIRRAG